MLLRSLLSLLILASSLLVHAQQTYPTSAKAVPLEPVESHYLARIELNTPEELLDALLRAQALAAEAQPERPIAFVLHGQEVYSLLKENKSKHPELFSLAEKLSQDKVVSIQVCNSWLNWKSINNGQLPNFVEKIEHAPTEIDRLIKDEGYTYF